MIFNNRWFITFFSVLTVFMLAAMDVSAQREDPSTLSRRDQARQILLDPQKLIDFCKSSYAPGIESDPLGPILQVSRHLFYRVQAEGDDDFLDAVLMTYIHLGLEEVDYNHFFTFPPQREYLPLDNKFCEDYIHGVAIEAASNITDDEHLKRRFEEFKDLDHSVVPFMLLLRMGDTQYVFDQIRNRADREISPEEASTLDHALSLMIKNFPFNVRYDSAKIAGIIDPLASSAANPLIRVAALQTTNNFYILSWHAAYRPDDPLYREGRHTSSVIQPFYIPESEDIMEMYKRTAADRLYSLTYPTP